VFDNISGKVQANLKYSYSAVSVKRIANSYKLCMCHVLRIICMSGDGYVTRVINLDHEWSLVARLNCANVIGKTNNT